MILRRVKIPLFALNFRQKTQSVVSSESLREGGSVFLILALACYMLAPALRGDWPVGQDHPAHLFRIWQLQDTLLQHHHLWSWSHRWFAGYPQNSIYPVGADFFVLGLRTLSFGKMSLGQAYGMAILVFYFLYGYAAFYLTRRASGSRVAGLLAVAFLLTDAGSNDTGGWFWLIDVGVWTSALGFVPALIGTVRIGDLLAKPAPRTAAAVAAYIGLAILCHPIHLIYFAIAVPLLCGSRFLTGEATNWRQASLWLGVAGLLGAGIASFWLIPYFAVFDFTRFDFARWQQARPRAFAFFTQMSAALAAGELFPRINPLASSFGFVGALFLLRSRRTLPLFVGLFAILCVTLACASFVPYLGPALRGLANRHILFSRIMMLAKPFWCAAAGILLVASWSQLHRYVDRGRDAGPAKAAGYGRWMRRIAMALFVGVCVLPVLGHALTWFFQHEVGRTTTWNSQRKDLKARKEFVAWAKEHMSPQQGFFRIAHGFGQDLHSLTDLGTDVPYPFFKIHVTPTGHFRYPIGSETNAAFRAANVRFALAAHPLTERDDLKLLGIFDRRLGLYQFKDWNPEPFEIDGQGPVKLVDFGDEDIVLEAGPEARGTLRLNVTYFPKWHASRDGTPMPIKAIPAPGVERSAFMVVDLLPGRYHFQYRRTVSDYAGTVLALLGVAGCVLLMRPSWVEALRRRFSKRPLAVHEQGRKHGEE